MDTIFVKLLKLYPNNAVSLRAIEPAAEDTTRTINSYNSIPPFYDPPMACMFDIILFFSARLPSASILASIYLYIYIYIYIYRHTRTYSRSYVRPYDRADLHRVEI